MEKINKCFVSKRHMRRRVKKELLETLSMNQKLIKISDKSQMKIVFQQSATQKENSNEKNIYQFALTEYQCTSVFPTKVDDVEPIRYIETPVDDKIDFQLRKCGTEFDGEVSSTTEEFVLDAMKQWVLKYRHLLSQRAINDMLQILRVPYPKFPADSRILLKTPNSCPYKIISVPPGFYCHIGIENTIHRLINNSINMQNFLFQNSEVVLPISINIDGLPISKSSKSQFWPILISMDIDSVSQNASKPFAVGIYHGHTKPTNVNQFLSEFITEFKHLQDNGFNICNKTVKIKASKLLCDAPAKSFVLCTKGHTGFYSCTKCTQSGIFINNRLAFPDINVNLRTDTSFKNKSDDEFHKGTTPFENINIGLVSQVPLDGMHLVFLGIIKKLITFWVRGPKNIRFTDDEKKTINDQILFLKNYVPKDFSRLPRSLDDIEYFKATELRQFLLYIGPIVLQNMRNKNMYTHFMTLSCAIRILCSPALYSVYNDYALQLIQYFVQKYSILYGPEFINHNVHGLLHLPADCLLHGPLDTFSCFKYENFLYEIKRKIKTTKHPLQQICNRLKEEEQAKKQDDKTYPILHQQIKVQIINKESCIFYKKLDIGKYEFTIENKENCVMIRDKSVLCVDSIFQNTKTLEIFIMGRKFTESTTFFNSPCSSKLFNVEQMQNISNDTHTININEIQTKCVKFPHKNEFIIMPLIHTQ